MARCPMDNQALPPNRWIDLEPSPPHSCPYLEDREIYLRPGVILPDDEMFDQLMASGHRRLGLVFYRPACEGCQECVPIRVPVDAFQRSRSQRRLWRRYAESYEVEILPPVFRQEHYELYVRHSQHVSEDNDPGHPESYTSAFLTSAVRTHLIEYKVEEELVAVSVVDEGAQAFSSVYVFWDPLRARLSPGTFSALWELRWARQRSKRYYHLGYYVSECSRMSYKRRFRPYELLEWQARRWRRLER